jgi:hypothetical protein
LVCLSACGTNDVVDSGPKPSPWVDTGDRIQPEAHIVVSAWVDDLWAVAEPEEEARWVTGSLQNGHVMVPLDPGRYWFVATTSDGACARSEEFELGYGDEVTWEVGDLSDTWEGSPLTCAATE